MRVIKCLTFIILSLIGLILHTNSCGNRNQNVDKVLAESDRIMELQPDNALKLLNTIVSPLDLDSYQYNRYLLLQIQAKDKTIQDITSDTIIFKVKDYFVNKKDNKNSALAYYYSGRVLDEQKNTKGAMLSYLYAETYVTALTDNHMLKGVIQSSMGYLLYDQLLYSEALTHFNKACEYFQLADNIEKEVILHINIGDCWALIQEPDSAIYSYNKGLDLANISQDSTLRVGVLHNLAVLYKDLESFNEAKLLFRQAMSLATKNEEKENLYLNLSQIFTRA